MHEQYLKIKKSGINKISKHIISQIRDLDEAEYVIKSILPLQKHTGRFFAIRNPTRPTVWAWMITIYLTGEGLALWLCIIRGVGTRPAGTDKAGPLFSQIHFLK